MTSLFIVSLLFLFVIYFIWVSLLVSWLTIYLSTIPSIFLCFIIIFYNYSLSLDISSFKYYSKAFSLPSLYILANWSRQLARAIPKFLHTRIPIAPSSSTPYDCSIVMQLILYRFEKWTRAVFFFCFDSLNMQ